MDEAPKKRNRYKNPAPKEQGWTAKYRLTPEIVDKICEFLEVGAPVTVSCAAAGIPKITYCKWLQSIERGETDGGKPLTPELIEFGRRVEEAKAKFHTNHLSLISSIGNAASKSKNWLPAAWLLERCQRDHYSLVTNNKSKAEVEITVKEAVADAEKLFADEAVIKDNAPDQETDETEGNEE
jgi:hypothetical protein